MVYFYDELDKITNNDYIKICKLNSSYGLLQKKYRYYIDSLRHELGIFLLYIYLKKIKKLCLFSLLNYCSNGRPQIPGYYLSISKCNNGILFGIDKEVIGVDIDDYQEEFILNEDVFLSNNEITSISSNFDYTFFVNCKEAYLKCIGSGIIKDISRLDFSRYLGQDKFFFDNLLFDYKKKNDYSYIICSKKKVKFKKISYQEVRRFINEL